MAARSCRTQHVNRGTPVVKTVSGSTVDEMYSPIRPRLLAVVAPKSVGPCTSEFGTSVSHVEFPSHLIRFGLELTATICQYDHSLHPTFTTSAVTTSRRNEVASLALLAGITSAIAYELVHHRLPVATAFHALQTPMWRVSIQARFPVPATCIHRRACVFVFGSLRPLDEKPRPLHAVHLQDEQPQASCAP